MLLESRLIQEDCSSVLHEVLQLAGKRSNTSLGLRYRRWLTASMGALEQTPAVERHKPRAWFSIYDLRSGSLLKHGYSSYGEVYR
jgi:hypothetical protein